MPPAFTLSQDQTLQLNLLPGTCVPDITLESDLSYFDYANYDSTIPLRIKVSRLGTLLIRWTLRSIPRRPHKSPAHTVKEPFRAGSTSGCPGAFHSREPRIIHPLESPSTPRIRSIRLPP